MRKREGDPIKLGLILSISLLGAIIYLIVSLGINYLFISEIIPSTFMGVISKLTLFIIGIWVGKIIKGKTREDKFFNSILGVIIFTLLILIVAIACAGWEIDIAGIVICILIGIIGCFILFVKYDKYSKMHKKRKKH